MDRYMILVDPLSSEEGRGFLAVVPDLPGCMSDGEARGTPSRRATNISPVWNARWKS